MKLNEKKLAFKGGERSISKKRAEYIFKHPKFNDEAIRRIEDLIKNRELSFPVEKGVIKKLERDLETYLGSESVLSFMNGTSALFSSLFAVGEGFDPKRALENKEVICPSYTWWSSILPVLELGGTPVFCEISKDSLTADVEDIKSKITNSTTAIMIPHLWGEVSNLKKLKEVSQKNDIPVIEDASHAFGASYDGEKIGTVFDIGAFSLQAGKSLPAGEGGILVTDSKKYYERSIILGHYERISEISGKYSDYKNTGLGYKFRMSALNASLALTKLKNFNDVLKKENILMDYFINQISSIPNIYSHRRNDEKFKRGGYFSTRFELDLSKFTIDKNTIIEAFRSEGVPFDVEYYSMLHTKKVFDGKSKFYGKGNLPLTEEIYPKLVAFKPFRRGTKKDVDKCINGVKKIINHFSNNLS